MESNNAVVDPSKSTVISKDKPADKSVVSPVPDLVTSVPTPEATTPNVPVKTDVAPAAAAQPSSVPTAKSTTPAAATVKTTQPNNTGTAAPRATSVPSAASEASVKNRSRDEKSRKKDDRSVDHVLRALNSLNTTEEKLAAMCKKYADIFDEHRMLQLLNKQTEKKCSMLQREKEQLQAEHSKAILTRSRLENLCRELQRQNKAIKDESLLKIREEEEKRKEVSAKFQSTMNEITSLMQQNNDKNMKLRDDNIDMTSKLKNICEQYEIRQQQVERISKQMQLEQQLADAKISKLKMEMSAEREQLLREKQQLLMDLQQYQQRCTEYQTTEISLRNQITMYNDKYEEFQKALARSNDVFGGFKGEMDKMSKKICKLEKETSSWKQRWERSHHALLEMAADKQKSEQELSVVSRQLATLQNLCRTLQAERTTLIANLKLFQGGNEPNETSVVDNQCTQQCDHTANHESESVKDGNIVLNQYTQDILADLSDGKTPDSSTVNTDSTPTPAPTVPEPQPPVTSPLPDVVETTNTCVNNEVCQRLKNLTLEHSAAESSENITQLVTADTESNVPKIEEVLRVEQPPSDLPKSVKQELVVENNTPVVVLNGETQVQINGSSTPEENSQKDNSSNSPQSPPKSPAVKKSPIKSGDNGKKTKESARKKKK